MEHNAPLRNLEKGKTCGSTTRSIQCDACTCLKGDTVATACPITNFDLVDVATETTRTGWFPTDRNVIINNAVAFNGKSFGIIWQHQVNKPFLIAP